MLTWNKSVIGKHTSDTAIQHNNHVIARFITYINNEQVKRYALHDVSTNPHTFIAWFNDSDSAKQYCEKLYEK